MRWRIVNVVSALVFVPLVPGPVANPAVPSLYLGIAGDAGRFKGQTGQESAIHHVFISWDQGRTFGKRIPVLLRSLAPIPMIHIGTGGPLGTSEAIEPAQIANGHGDAFLVALNQGIAEYGELVYLRLMAEMNHFRRFHAAYRRNGTSKGPAYSPETYRKAFARMYLLLHGGPSTPINAALRRLSLPGFTGGGLASNPPSRLRVIWNPLGGGQPAVPGNAATRYYPATATSRSSATTSTASRASSRVRRTRRCTRSHELTASPSRSPSTVSSMTTTPRSSVTSASSYADTLVSSLRPTTSRKPAHGTTSETSRRVVRPTASASRPSGESPVPSPSNRRPEVR